MRLLRRSSLFPSFFSFASSLAVASSTTQRSAPARPRVRTAVRWVCAAVGASVGGLALAACSEAGGASTQGSSRVQTFAASSQSADARVATFALERDDDGRGFSISARDPSGAIGDAVRVRVGGDGARLTATLASRPGEFVYWSEALGVGGSPSLRGAIAGRLAVATADAVRAAVSALSAPGAAPRREPTGDTPAAAVGTRSLIDRGSGPLLDNDARVTCATGLLHALATAAALLGKPGPVDAHGDERPSDDVRPTEGVRGGVGPAAAGGAALRIAGMLDVLADVEASSACGSLSRLEALAVESEAGRRAVGEALDCVAVGLTELDAGGHHFVCGGTPVTVALCGTAGHNAPAAAVPPSTATLRMCKARCGVACALVQTGVHPAECPFPDAPGECCVRAPGPGGGHLRCRSDGSLLPGLPYAIDREP
jgi:hypothetical protein